MSDVRERHVMGHADPDQGCEPVCVCCGTLWPCDAIQMADLYRDERALLESVEHERDAARADADRLAKQLEACLNEQADFDTAWAVLRQHEEVT